MGRTAAPATPGTDPNAAPATPGGDTGTDVAQDSAAAAASGAPAGEVTLADAMALIKAQQEQMKAMQVQMQLLGRNQVAQAMPEKVQLPELGTVMKQKPDVPVLTQGGWYVPPVLPQQRIV